MVQLVYYIMKHWNALIIARTQGYNEDMVSSNEMILGIQQIVDIIQILGFVKSRYMKIVTFHYPGNL